MKSLADDKKIRTALLDRLLVVLFVFAVWSGLVVVRLVELQALRSGEFKLQAEVQQSGFFEVQPKRGEILDRNLQPLAVTVPASSVYVRPQEINEPVGEGDIQTLARLLDTPASTIRETLESQSRFSYLRRAVSPELARQVRRLNLEGLGTHETVARAYPAKQLASHVLGFVSVDQTGLAGLEYQYETELGGESSRVNLLLDARRNSYSRLNDVSEQTEGNTLVLTLDAGIQHVAQKVLRDTVTSTEALNGSALVMDPDTGEILAMASWPQFNPNSPGEFPESSYRNRAILDMYEPGSTFKIITLAALLDLGLAHPEEVIDCRPGTARIASKVYREAKRSFGYLTVREVLAKSSNIGTVKMALRLGEERLFEYVSRLGFGQKTGIDLPGEQHGLFRPIPEWSRLSIGSISIGQEIGVTPLQLARAVSAIANGGLLVRPHLVRQVQSPQGHLLSQTRAEKRRVLKEETSRVMRALLMNVVENGTGRNAILKGYTSAGKTGTAQKIVNGVYSHRKYVASFVGFAPAHDPELLCLVVVNEPEGIPYGGTVAAPAFKQIMERALIHLKVPQDRPEEVEPSDLEWVKRAPAEGEPAMLDFQHTVAEVLEQEEWDRDDFRDGGILISLSGKTLPDFTGQSLRRVARRCAELNIQLKISGEGRAVAQRPEPGRPVTRGMTCEVFFSNPADADETRTTASRHSRGHARVAAVQD